MVKSGARDVAGARVPCEWARSHSSLLVSDTVSCGCRACFWHVIEDVAHESEGAGCSLCGSGPGWSREVVRLSGLVSSEDVRGVLQVLLGQPEVILRPIPFEPHEVFWSLLGPDQSILHFKLFLIIHQLWWGGLVRWPDLLGAGVIRFQVLHILKWG